jgi:hypothetical protein
VPGEASQTPEQLVAGAQPRTLARRPGEDRELLAQEEVLCHQVAAGADDRMEQRDQEQQALIMGGMIAGTGPGRPARFLGPDNVAQVPNVRSG